MKVFRQIGKLDSTTGDLTVINHEHDEIHKGDHYFIEGFATLAAAATLYVKLVTPDTLKWSHFVWAIGSSAILETNLYEDATGGMTGGAGVTPINNNRNSANTSGIVITSGVTTNTGGTKISTVKFGSRSIGSSVSRADEIILKQNTVYCREFISGTNANIVNFKASWYEHTNE